MVQRLLFALAGLVCTALFLGSAVLGAWAEDHGHVWLSRACVVGAGSGLVGAGGCLLFAVTPRALRRAVFPHWPADRDRLKLPEDWRG
ncbi:hypothetical protein [Streptomyces sp. NBC_01618]|uniref:hypothetical protein n=1 Tax=Streptomyces sp. NBC_01618 TaxID=2975900 RepID=UPI00387053D2|nr:hypothetical protein OH735_25390 [Streptomyces sp. NBC_01618]